MGRERFGYLLHEGCLSHVYADYRAHKLSVLFVVLSGAMYEGLQNGSYGVYLDFLTSTYAG